MQVYHQCGHNTVWNVDSMKEDQVGDGLILSPVNIDSDKIIDKVPLSIREKSFFDPQFYIPGDAKSKLATYKYFPENIEGGFLTVDYRANAVDVARECLQFQLDLGLKYLVIPSRYYNNVTSSVFSELTSYFVEPFLEAYDELGVDTPILLTAIVSESQLGQGDLRDESLDWITKFSEISGVYLILDNSFSTKQVQDAGYLCDSLEFISDIRSNSMEVHAGYTGLEGLLYSIADVSSVTFGAYENLKSFGVERLQTKEKERKSQPTPRLFSDRLLQSMSVRLIPPFERLYPEWKGLVADTKYREYLVENWGDLNSQRPEICKHYFTGFYDIAKSLPAYGQDRVEFVMNLCKDAISGFQELEDAKILVEDASNGAHLFSWVNAISMFEASKK